MSIRCVLLGDICVGKLSFAITQSTDVFPRAHPCNQDLRLARKSFEYHFKNVQLPSEPKGTIEFCKSIIVWGITQSLCGRIVCL